MGVNHRLATPKDSAMPSPSKTLSKRAHEKVETIEKRLKLPFVPVSTRVFYDILSKNDAHSEEVKDISLPKPKAILEYESVEYAIPGLKVPVNEEDGEMDRFVEDYQEEEEESLQEGLFKPTFFKSEKEVDDMVESAFGITQASES